MIKPLVRFNPTVQNQQEDHSEWLANRGLSACNVSVNNFTFISNDMKAIHAENSDLPDTVNLTQCSYENGLLTANNVFKSMQFNGTWFHNEGVAIGMAINKGGTIGKVLLPFNTHNIGRKINGGWRPGIID